MERRILMIVMCMLGMSLLFAVYASIRVNRLEERVEHLEKKSHLMTETERKD